MKRGERARFTVRYVWSNGIKGAVSYSTRDRAELQAERIREAGTRGGHDGCQTVVVTVVARTTENGQNA